MKVIADSIRNLKQQEDEEEEDVNGRSIQSASLDDDNIWIREWKRNDFSFIKPILRFLLHFGWSTKSKMYVDRWPHKKIVADRLMNEIPISLEVIEI